MKKKLWLSLLIFTCYALNSNAQNANTKLSNLASPTTINQSLLPNTDKTKDLGSSTRSWRNIYLSNALYLKGKIAIHSPGIDLGNFLVGTNAGKTSATGFANTGSGEQALFSITSGSYNTANGFQALYSNKTGSTNTAIGNFSMYSNVTGLQNAAVGAWSMYSNTNGGNNTAVGFQALYANKGDANTAIGATTLTYNTTGFSNTAGGYSALNENETGSGNTAYGGWALVHNSYGSYNTAIGQSSLMWEYGDYNTALGYNAGAQSGTRTNSTSIGANATTDASNQVRIGDGSVQSIGGNVGWSVFSDGRYKRDIKENVPGLAFINSLRPVTYTVNVKGLNEYRRKGKKQSEEKTDQRAKAVMDKAEEDAGKIIHNGFIAQEVEEAAKKLSYEFSGVDKPQTKEGLYGLRYDNFIVPLAKAVQELSKMNDEKDAKIDNLQRQIDELKKIIPSNIRSTSSSKAVTKIILTSATLEQNSPNPFTSTTAIRYNLPAPVKAAQMIITDNSGKNIKQVQLNTTGEGVVNVDASTLGSGTYNYILLVDGKAIECKKMVVAR